MSRYDIARLYEELYSRGYNSVPNASHKAVLDLAPAFKEMGVLSVIDIGCGRGYLIRQLGFLGFVTCGTEVVETLFERDLKKLDIYPCPIHEMCDFADDEFDAAMMVNVLDHLLNMGEAVLAINEATRISSKAVLVVVGGDSVERTINHSGWLWRIDLENAGLNVIEEVQISPECTLILSGVEKRIAR